MISAVALQGDQPHAAPVQLEGTPEVYLPIVQSSSSAETTSDWIGPDGGPVTDIIFDPVNTNTVFAAASIGGVYKSTDGGVSWRNISTGIENLDITAIGISAMNPLVL